MATVNRRKQIIKSLLASDPAKVPTMYQALVEYGPNPEKGEETWQWKKDYIEKVKTVHLSNCLEAIKSIERREEVKKAVQNADVEIEMLSRASCNMEVRFKPGNLVSFFMSVTDEVVSINAFHLIESMFNKMMEAQGQLMHRIKTQNYKPEPDELMTKTEFKKMALVMELLSKYKNELIEDLRQKAKTDYAKQKSEAEINNSLKKKNIIVAGKLDSTKKRK